MDGGAIGLLLFVLPCLVIDGVARLVERQRGTSFAWRDLVRKLTLRRFIVAVAGVLFVSVLLVGWAAQSLVEHSERARVVSVRLSTGQPAPEYRGLMLAAHTDGRYIFVDRFARGAKVYVVNAESIAELQLESWSPDQSMAQVRAQ
jgi:hypothetical protein